MTIQKMSAEGKRALTLEEGDVLHAYKDTGGVWTIGRGITTAAGLGPIRKGMVITQEQSDDMFEQALLKYESRVRTVFTGYQLSQAAFDAAVGFDYNTGKIYEATWPKLYLQNKWSAAESSLKLWIHDNGKVIGALQRRRDREADMLFRNQYPEVPSVEKPQRQPTHEEVTKVQQFLTSRGMLKSRADGILGPHTKAAILLYQQLHPDLVADGILGPATLAQITRDAQLIPKLLDRTIIPAAVTATGFMTSEVPDISQLIGHSAKLIGFCGALSAVVVVGLFLWRNQDLISRRINRILTRA